MRLLRSDEVSRETTTSGSPGRNSVKAFFACFRSSLRSQRKRMRRAQPALMSTSQIEMATRVFPVPVAWTSRDFRCLSVNLSPTRRTASS